MVRLSLQVKVLFTKSCFSYCCCDVLCILHAFEHRKANLIKHDLSRLERLFSRQFEELKHKDICRKKMKITCRQPIKKIYLVVHQVNSPSLIIVCKGVPAHPPFYGTHPLTQLAPLIKIFVSPPLISIPPPFRHPPPSCNPLLP